MVQKSTLTRDIRHAAVAGVIQICLEGLRIGNHPIMIPADTTAVFKRVDKRKWIP